VAPWFLVTGACEGGGERLLDPTPSYRPRAVPRPQSVTRRERLVTNLLTPSWRNGTILRDPSQAVLTRAGFVSAGSVELDGQPEVRFVRDLTVDGTGWPADR
jgi:hypothetical protein